MYPFSENHNNTTAVNKNKSELCQSAKNSFYCIFTVFYLLKIASTCNSTHLSSSLQ